ncbi:MAG: hypothetical protein Q8900_02820 [Bacillota bacterium]|nr:hypothetical protein [Bacillota bacterium]
MESDLIMKIIKNLSSFLISLIMMFILLMIQISFFVQNVLYKPDFYLTKFQNMGLYDYIQTTIEKDNHKMAQVTNLPEDLFGGLITKDWIKGQFEKGTKQDIDYMLYKSNNLAEPDPKSQADIFGKKLDTYISSKNLKYDDSVKKELDKIKTDLYNVMKNETTFIGMHNLNNYGFFQQFRHYSYLVYKYQTAFIIGLCVLIGLLLLLLRNKFKFFNWIAYTLIANGMLILIPSVTAYLSKFMDNINIEIAITKLITASIIRDYISFFIKIGAVTFVLGILILLISVKLENRNYEIKE